MDDITKTWILILIGIAVGFIISSIQQKLLLLRRFKMEKKLSDAWKSCNSAIDEVINDIEKENKKYPLSDEEALAIFNQFSLGKPYLLKKLLSSSWITKKYTYPEDKNEHETPENMILGIKEGWIRI
jgi:hypothetical protein